MKAVTAEQMKEIDRIAIKEYGIPGIVLMENAALGVLGEIKKDLGALKNKNVVIFAGTGSNGGDALGVARHAFIQGANVLVVLVGAEKNVKGDALTNLNIVKNMKINTVFVEEDLYNEEIAASLLMADAVVDGLLGTGLNKPVQGLMAQIIDIINNAGRYTVSIDIPSGVNGTTGEINGVCINAHKTITLGLPKIGMLCGEGAKHAGQFEVADIGIPVSILDKIKLDTTLLTYEYVSRLIPVRSKYAHKGDNGKVLVIAGSTGFTGAAALTSRAAQRTGSGLVTLGIPERLNGIMEIKLTEEMTLPLADTGEGNLSIKCIEKLKTEMDKVDVIAYGSGIGKGKDVSGITEWLLCNSRVPIVIDSDGINSLEGNIDLLKNAVCPIILTPHMGEMARLTGLSVQEIQRGKIKVLKECCEKYKCTIVLKDWRTIICDDQGQIFINPTGNQGMAAGGTGDVLTGIIASFVGRGMTIPHSAAAGVYVHGLAGDFTAAEKGMEGMTAGDITEMIPYALKSVRE